MKFVWHLFLLLGLWNGCQAATPPLALVAGSMSPDRRLAVAYVPEKPGQEDFEENDGVFLVEARSKKIIGPIPDCYSSGGGHGTRAENVSCAWHPTGRYLIVNQRSGRMIGGGMLFRLEGKQLFPVSLPVLTTHPKSKILEFLSSTTNAGNELYWENSVTLVCRQWGYTSNVTYSEDAFAKYGLDGFCDVLEFVFRLNPNGTLRLADLRVP